MNKKFQNSLSFLTLIIILFSFIEIGCVKQRQLTGEEISYDYRILNQPTTFSLPNEKAEEAWSRANQFIATNSSYKIQTANSYIIQTYSSSSALPMFGYNVSRSTNGNMTLFVIQCFHSNMFSKKEADYNAHALAHYMVTGELMPNRIFK